MSRAFERLLILTKTYPTPSTKHRETTCVAAFNEAGQLLRLFPVPFRLLGGAQQFSKWEWIRGQLAIPTGDNRPESRRIDVNTIEKTDRELGTEHGWAARRRLIEPHVMDGLDALEARRQATGQTLGFIRPANIASLDITPVEHPDWTEKDRANLMKDGLFDTDDVRARPPLKKLPYDFHYTYESVTGTGVRQIRNKITDWEVGALFWNCWYAHGSGWERPFREKLEVELASKDLLFLMGTIHRFPDQWLIVGLVYPPKPQLGAAEQLPLQLGH
jgi:hypothetical protein